ncbi:MAG: hypothetical protein LAO77_21340, partial [Acidobacteriia bacterium]|nr:hypothetical protein [Terriglobia bacterium]
FLFSVFSVSALDRGLHVRSIMTTKPPYDLSERTFQFACNVVRFCRKMSAEPGVVRHISWQLAAAGETEVTAHYIAVAPAERSKQYINFVHVLKKREMDACAKHRTSKHDSWREGMQLMWDGVWAAREDGVNRRYAAVLPGFQRRGRPRGSVRRVLFLPLIVRSRRHPLG